MKRIAFAWSTYVIDFSTEKEARDYAMKNQGKGWRINVYENTDCWTAQVQKPIKGYYPGW